MSATDIQSALPSPPKGLHADLWRELQNVKDNPDDDSPRLAVAEWLVNNDAGPSEKARGEFIRAQCALNGLDESDASFPALQEQARQLVQQHAGAWIGARDDCEVGNYPLVYVETNARRQRGISCSFTRGFAKVESCGSLWRLGLHVPIVWPVVELVRKASRKLGLSRKDPPAPDAGPVLPHYWVWVDSLKFSAYYTNDVERLGSWPQLSELNHLELQSNLFRDQDFAALASSPWLFRLRSLTMWGFAKRRVAAAAELAVSNHLPNLTRLEMPRTFAAGCEEDLRKRYGETQESTTDSRNIVFVKKT